ncbi:MAG: DUF805 domain-containing protein [Rhodobacteraceae bacterium]|nr:DUF805 domain-containing protein [Paracoccaceae bacterium]
MKKWYFAENEARLGPLPSEQMADMVAAGKIKPDTLVWHKGLLGWEPARMHFFSKTQQDTQPSQPPTHHSRTAPAPDYSLSDKNGTPDFAARVAQRHQAEGRWDSSDPRAYAEQSITADRAAHLQGDDGHYTGAPSRSFLEAIKVCFKKYATFKGRASRSEYWYFMLFMSLITAFGQLATINMGDDGKAISGVISLVTFMPSISVQVRRLHDVDRSGWWLGGYWLLLFGGGSYLGFVGYQMLVAGDAANIGTGTSGLLAIWGLVLAIVSIMLLIFSVRHGTRGPNRFA